MAETVAGDIRQWAANPPSWAVWDTVATDPPWGQGPTTYFANLAGRPVPKWDELIEALAAVCHNRPSLVLMGDRWVHRTREILESGGCTVFRIVATSYKSGSCSLVVANGEFPVFHRARWQHTMLSHLECIRLESVVLDPFAGHGSIAGICRDAGLQYLGLELNPKRVRV